MNSEELESRPKRMGMSRGKPQKKGRQGRPDVEQPRAPAKGGTVGCFVAAQIPIV